MPPPPCRWRDRIEIRKIRGNFRIRKFPRTPSKNFEKARSDLFICRGDHWSLLRVCTEIPQRTALIKPSPVGEGGTRSVTDEVLPRMKCDAYASTTQKRPPCWVVFRVVETTVNPPLRGSGIQNACAYSDAAAQASPSAPQKLRRTFWSIPTQKPPPRKKTTLLGGLSRGGDNWNRTSDPLHVKQVL